MSILLLSMTTLQANKMALAHTNPMPNLMRIASGNAELLKITPDQMKSIKAWTKEHKPKMKEMIKKVMSEEKKLLEDALNTDNDSVKQAEVMLETRKKIIEMKTTCRKTLKSILSKEQYAGVISIYKSMN
ncbi:MAG: Unknown protein [uncultured Sulfurovum sp.]|uniref:Periplasmic protein n=1 Tax=uncultured Sulfurovum sp. TaxID=269237 RepID=A0A6S6U063_9BACT|nr:MAG: Unknown protein [uncultured Sulfurovum sp.]